jgi:hexosaminidase
MAAMRFIPAPAAALLTAIALPLPPAGAAVDHDLMPAPQTLEWRTGRLAVDARFTAAFRGADDGRGAEALQRFQQRLAAQTGVRLPAPGAAGAAPSLLVEVTAASLPVQAVGEDESYELAVDAQKARLTAPTTLGALRGLETLLQLVRQEGGRWAIPAVRVADGPRFPWRGLLIDPSRRWQPVESILRILDGMASVKLNVLHWHLSEDQGFRVESRVFPRLHQQGSDGLFYTQEEVRTVIRAARARGIRVVPEFDIPGHATSWLVGHPELGSAPGPFELVRNWGIFDNTLDPSREEVYAFLDKFLGEMAGLFPDAYLHIGGDEVTPRQWSANPAIQDFMYEKDLRDANDLQAHFNRRVNEILTRHGKRMVGWDEILRPELPKSIVVQSWRGAQALARAAELGYDGLLSNGFYVDLNFSAESHYLPDPIPADSTLSAEARKHVLGGEACMWGELVSPETIDSRLWPRVAAVAERLWSPAELRDVDDMYRRLEVASARLDRLGMKHLSNYTVMLERLAAGGAVEPLRTLADLVEPLKEYRRGRMRLNTQSMPLERLVDAARPESIPARTFRKSVDRFLLTPPGSRDDAALRATLEAWARNHQRLEPVLAASPLAREARSLSRDLSAAASLGLAALDGLQTGRSAPASWGISAAEALDHAAKPRIELELVVVPAVRKLVLAAARLDEARTMPLEEWNRKLDEQLKAAAQRPPEH